MEATEALGSAAGAASVGGQNPVDESTWGTPDVSHIPDHFRDHAMEVLEQIPKNPAEFKVFREQWVCLGRGPESFITNQAAFAMCRMMRDRSEFDRAEQIGMVHRDLMRRLDQCLNPEGFAEQYLWMLQEGSIIENMYARSVAEAQNARVEENSDVHEERECDENAEQYQGSVSECSDPDGWIRINYADGS